MLPLDRLRREGATEDELTALQELPEAEQLSIELELQPVAESGIREFLERYRRTFEDDRADPRHDESAEMGSPPAKPSRPQGA